MRSSILGLVAVLSIACGGAATQPVRTVSPSSSAHAPSAREPKNDDGDEEDQALLARAAKLYEKDCANGNVDACYEVGRAYDDGRGVAKDQTRAVTAYTAACDKHHAGACNNLGVIFELAEAPMKPNLSGARDAYKRGCDYGSATACANLGELYENAKGVAEDVQLAKRLYEKGCNAKSGRACVDLGLLLESGRVGEPSRTTYALYEKACEWGDSAGCTDYGVTLDNGEGIAEDPARAATFYQKGCDAGDAHGCALLGSMYEKGRGVVAAPQRARELYKRACDKDDAYGCEHLAKLKQASK